MIGATVSASVEQARAWLAQDPDPRTREELETLIAQTERDAAAEADLDDRFAGRLAFGTARTSRHDSAREATA